METSLTGKALDFGSKEYGFESHVSNLSPYYFSSFVINHLKIHAASKTLVFSMLFTKKNFDLVTFFKKHGLIRRFYIFFDPITKKKKLKIFIFFFKGRPLYYSLMNLSTPSKFFFISHHALNLLNKRTGSSVFFLSTDRGIISHKEALKLKRGGKVLGFFSY